MRYEDALSFLREHMRFGIKPGLLRTRALLAEMGNPEREMRFLHIAGTNGKGSVASMTEAALRGCCIRTGLFTSPHLSSYTERIRVCGEEISEEELAELTEHAASASVALAGWRADMPTEFEMCTAICLEHFRRRGVELAVMEVGLGGRYDSTNVIASDVSVITHISYDHMERLGNTLGEIAFDKCGIMKPGVRVVSARQDEEALAMIRREAAARGCRLDEPGFGYRYESLGTGLDGTVVRYEGDSFIGTFRTPLVGVHQADNLAASLRALEALIGCGWDIDPVSAQEGLMTASHPGRFEVLEGKVPVILDGAHNPDGAEALAGTLAAVMEGSRPVALAGFSSDKPFQRMIGIIAPHISALVATGIAHARSGAADPAKVAEAARASGLEALFETDQERALDIGLAMAAERGVPLLVCGSLYLIGEIRQKALLGRKAGHGI